MNNKKKTSKMEELKTLSRHLSQGDEALQRGDLDRAMQQFELARQDTAEGGQTKSWLREAAFADVLSRIGRVHEAKGNHQAALICLREAVTILKDEKGYDNREELTALHERIAAALRCCRAA